MNDDYSFRLLVWRAELFKGFLEVIQIIKEAETSQGFPLCPFNGQKINVNILTGLVCSQLLHFLQQGSQV